MSCDTEDRAEIIKEDRIGSDNALELTLRYLPFLPVRIRSGLLVVDSGPAVR